MKIAIKTLGCKVNQAESASMEGLLRESGFQIVTDSSKADLCIVNTCTVTARSDAEARRIMRQAARAGSRVIATGCYAQLRPDELRNIEGVDLVIGNSEKKNISDFVQKISTKGAAPIINYVSEATYPLDVNPYFSRRARGFLKIQDGCNFSCSYCTIPRARGKGRSLQIPAVLKSLDEMASQGFREVVLTGIHVGSYGQDLDRDDDLISLLMQITESYPEIRFRISSLELHEFRAEMIQLMKSGRVCPHYHIPLQSGSDRILKLMNRGYTASKYSQIINRIFTGYPEVSIGADVIAGFPGESEKDFDFTVKLINDLPLSYLHVFPYSKRPGTKASEMPGQISPELARERVSILRKISDQKKNNFKMSNIGAILDVIVENYEPISSSYLSISGNYLKISVENARMNIGDRALVRVKSLTEGHLTAELPD